MTGPLYKVGDKAQLVAHQRLLDWGVPPVHFGTTVEIIEVRPIHTGTNEYFYRMDNRWFALESMLQRDGPW